MAAGEGWMWSVGVWYVLGNVAGVGSFVDEVPQSAWGDFLDVLASIIVMVINTTVISFAAGLSFVGDMPDRLGLASVRTCAFMLAFIIPVVLTVSACGFGAVISFSEG
jgi:hypothetical protein